MLGFGGFIVLWYIETCMIYPMGLIPILLGIVVC